MLTTYECSLTRLKARFDSLNERVDEIYEKLTHATTLAGEVAEAPFSRMDQLEEKAGRLVRSLEIVLSRAEVRIEAEEAKVMGRVEKLEKNVDMLIHKVDAVCKHLGIAPDQQDEIRRRPHSSEEDMGEMESVLPKPISETAGAPTPAPAPALVPATLDHPVGALVPHDPTEDAAATPPANSSAPAQLATKPAASTNPSSQAATNVDEAAVTTANAAATPADAAAAPANAAATIVPPAHPGVSVIHPTPDNSQDIPEMPTTLIPPGAFNAAGMRTRSRSRS